MERKEILVNLHGYGIILAGMLAKLLLTAVQIIWKSLIDIFWYMLGDFLFPVEHLMEAFPALSVIYTIVYVLCFVKLIYLIAWMIAVIVLIRKEIKRYVHCTSTDDSVQYIKVKKTPYVWLGFLLGSFGAHLFLMEDKTRAWIYLFLGLVGGSIQICMWYTMGISFVDAWLACYLPKDSEGYVEIMDYKEMI